MKPIRILIFSFILSGCLTINYDGLHDIITKNVKIYQNSEGNFSNVTAILKEYSNSIKDQKFKNVKDIRTFTKYFLIQIEEGYISKNYPVKAAKSEIKAAKSIILDTISYIEAKNIANHQYKSCIHQSIKIYVTEIINHEKEVLQ